MTEIERYIQTCREMSNGGEFKWWSRLAEILDELETECELSMDEIRFLRMELDDICDRE